MNTKPFVKEFLVGGMKVEAVKLDDETPLGYKVYSFHDEDEDTNHNRAVAVMRYLRTEGFNEEFFLGSPAN